MEDVGRPHRHLPHGRDHRAARRPRRGARGEGVRARGRGVHARLDAAGGADPLREARADAGPQGQDRLLDRHARPAHDPRRARDRRRDRGVARVLEAAEHVPRAAAGADRRGRPPAHDVQPGGRRRPGGSRRRTRTCRRSRSAPSSAARSAPRSSPSRASSCSRRTTRRSSCASSRTSPASRSCARRSRAARTSTRRPRPRCSARTRPTLTTGERSIAKMINFGIVYGISAFGLSENLEIPREQAQAYIDAYLARFPHVQDFIERTIEQAERDGYVTSLLGRRRPVPEIRASQPRRRARSASGWPSTSSCRARTRTSSRWRWSHPPAAARGGPRREARPAGARRAAARGAGRRGLGRARARPRGDVRRLRARPAARGRRRRRRRLGRSQVS